MAPALGRATERRVVISGMGAVCAAGLGVDRLWTAARDGVSQIRPLKTRRPYDGRIKIAGQVPDFDPAEHIDAGTLPFCDPFTQFSVVAADEAMAQAGFGRKDISGPGTAVIIGTGPAVGFGQTHVMRRSQSSRGTGWTGRSSLLNVMSLRRVLLLAGVMVAVGGAWMVYRNATAVPPIDPSKLAAVERGPMVRSVVATGKIEPVTKVELKSKANGIIERLLVDVDQQVQTGQVLAELDKEMLHARLREARANLEAASASLQAAEAQETKSAVEAESPDVAFTKAAVDRATSLQAQQLMSRESFDQAASAYQQALNRQRAAASQLLIARARVAEARAQRAQSQAAVERAEEELANATLRAPIHGTVLTRDVEVGSAVSSILNLGANATLVMTLGDIGQVFVRGQVDEADIGVVRLHQPARITTESFPGKVFTGRVTQISPIGVDKDNVITFEVEVSIDNSDLSLKANMTANAEIILEEHADALHIPEAAITYDAQRAATVHVPDPSAPGGRRTVSVTVGISNGTRTEILSGLQAGDRVVLPG